MQPIKLIDKSHAKMHTDFEYAPADAARSFWTGRYPIEGKVAAYLCERCGRIALYGRPNVAEASRARTADAAVAKPETKTTPCFSCGEPIPETDGRCPACGWSKR
jgi:hypothetical protein